MKFRVMYDPDAERTLEKLPRDTAKRIVKKLGTVSKTGRGIEPLKNAAYGYKIRIGAYRVLVDVTPHTIWVRHIDHRKRVYKR